MSARMEKVREALKELRRHAGGLPWPLHDAALAEVEEWETRRVTWEAYRKLTERRLEAAEDQLRVYGKRNALTLLTRRAETAEAEAERWHREALDWQQAKSEADDACDHAAARAEAAEAALRALVEQVEMDESVGICLSDRVAALNALQVLTT